VVVVATSASPVITLFDAVAVANDTPAIVIVVSDVAVSSAVVFAFNAGVVATVAPCVINGVVAVGE